MCMLVPTVVQNPHGCLARCLSLPFRVSNCSLSLNSCCHLSARQSLTRRLSIRDDRGERVTLELSRESRLTAHSSRLATRDSRLGSACCSLGQSITATLTSSHLYFDSRFAYDPELPIALASSATAFWLLSFAAQSRCLFMCGPLFSRGYVPVNSMRNTRAQSKRRMQGQKKKRGKEPPKKGLHA